MIMHKMEEIIQQVNYLYGYNSPDIVKKNINLSPQ
jgi:hypothetical protein